MKIGVAGLGKVGLPVALTLAVRGGHEVTGYDPSPDPAKILAGSKDPPREQGIEELLAADHGIRLAKDPDELVKLSDLVIIAVPTPHPPGYGGEVPVMTTAANFDYRYLRKAVGNIGKAADRQEKYITVSVLSTVLPGTMVKLCDRAGKHINLVYSPVFISLGTTISEFCYPPFILCGTAAAGTDWDPGDFGLGQEDPVREMYATLPAASGSFFVVTGYETAEIAKMAYNTWGSLRITFANQVAELCHKAGGNCDEVTRLMHFAPVSVRSGMPDGGPCRPRDLIAMSWLAQEHDLSHDLFRDITRTRERHARWIAQEVQWQAVSTGLPPVILGTAYKPGTDLEAGSPSLLVRYYLRDSETWNPGMPVPEGPRVYLAAVDCREVREFPFAPGSVVVDPWGTVPEQEGVRVIRLGRN